MSIPAARQVASYLADIPSPTKAQYHLGPIPIRMYAMCILAGILVAVWLGDKRWRARGGKPQEVVDIAIWAVPFGLVGGRLYHVITTSAPYFGKDGDPVKAFYVWQGGLGIWGAIALGALGAYIGCRRRGASLRTFADAVAPGIVLAQALGRWGNWFNNELYGRHTGLPWGLNVHVMDSTTQTAVTGPDGRAELVAGGPFHPTFLYESIWCVGVAALCLWADRRFKLGHGRVFAIYVAAYTVGRFWIESLRIDDAHHFLGMRLNDWTAIIVFLGAVAYFVWSSKKYPGRESTPYRSVPEQAPETGEDAGEGALTEDALVGGPAGEPGKLVADSEPSTEAGDVRADVADDEPDDEPDDDNSAGDESADETAVDEDGQVTVAVVPAQDGGPETVSTPAGKANES